LVNKYSCDFIANFDSVINSTYSFDSLVVKYEEFVECTNLVFFVGLTSFMLGILKKISVRIVNLC